jgi:hypothetical protein
MKPSFEISKQKNGFWLYDHTRKMNLSVGAQTEQLAFIEAIHYYQKRLAKVESELSTLQMKVDDFVSQFQENDND